MNLFMRMCIGEPKLADLNKRNIAETLGRIQHTVETTREQTHAAVYMSLVESGKDERYNVTAHSGGWDEGTWWLLATAVHMQPNLPPWRRWLIVRLLLMKRWGSWL